MGKHSGGQDRRQALYKRLALTPEEADQLRESERAVARASEPRPRLHDALRQWETFVRQVEGGYGDTDEYDNDLAVRSQLEGVMRAVPSIRDRLLQIIEPLDDRFMAATRPTVFPNLHFFDENGRILPKADVPWWAFRVPRLWPAQAGEENSPWDERGQPLPETRRIIERRLPPRGGHR